MLSFTIALVEQLIVKTGVYTIIQLFNGTCYTITYVNNYFNPQLTEMQLIRNELTTLKDKIYELENGNIKNVIVLDDDD